jgi:capsular exopolysaccharide synthesis family protein
MDPLKVQPPQETKLHFLDYWRIIRIRKTVILAVFLLVVITATLVTFVLPERFASTARIKVERDQSDIPNMQGQGLMPGVYDPYFIQTEFEVMRSELILSNVVVDLDLNNQWGKKFGGGEPFKTPETIKLLKGRIDLNPVRNTALIDIRVTSDKPEEAAKIANAIATVYQKHRVEERKRLSEGGITALFTRLEEQSKKVHEAQTNVDDLRIKLRISDTTPTSEGSANLLSSETLRQFEGIRIQSTVELVRQQKLLDGLMRMDRKQLADVLTSAGVTDPQLNSLIEQKTLADQRLVALKQQYGPEHPDVLSVSAQVEDLSNKLRDRVNATILGLQTRVDSLVASLTTLSNEVNLAMTNDVLKAAESRPYWEAKRKLEEQTRINQMLDFKIFTERVDTELPKTSMVEIVETAKIETVPVYPKKVLNISLGIIIGLVVGVGLAFFIEYLDTSVKTIDDVERSLGSPVLGVIPQNVGIILDEGAESPHAEAYRVLRTNLLFSRKDDKLNTVAIVSAGAGEGKSTTVFNLAAVFAQSGQRVLMVDSDLRRPTLHKMLRVTNNFGLTNYLLKQNTLEEVIQTTSLPTLDFMASGKLPSSSLGILSSAQMRDLIGQLKQHYDFVFFDSPPVMGVSDASILASEVDMTLQVIQYRRYPQPMNIRAKQLIEKVGGNLVGIVLNNINMSQDESYYYYSGYYHEYYSRNEDQEPPPPSDGGSDAQDKIDIKPKY